MCIHYESIETKCVCDDKVYRPLDDPAKGWNITTNHTS